MVFGRSLLHAVFKYVRKQILDRFHMERERMAVDRRVILTHFPAFLNTLEAEVYAPSSPIWDPEFKPPPSPYSQHFFDLNKRSKSNLFPT